MTVIEKQYMDAVIQMNRRQRDTEPDWEQRRYEIAKDYLSAMSESVRVACDRVYEEATTNGESSDFRNNLVSNVKKIAVDVAVEMADRLVVKLKETAEKK